MARTPRAKSGPLAVASVGLRSVHSAIRILHSEIPKSPAGEFRGQSRRTESSTVTQLFVRLARMRYRVPRIRRSFFQNLPDPLSSNTQHLVIYPTTAHPPLLSLHPTCTTT